MVVFFYDKPPQGKKSPEVQRGLKQSVILREVLFGVRITLSNLMFQGPNYGSYLPNKYSTDIDMFGVNLNDQLRYRNGDIETSGFDAENGWSL